MAATETDMIAHVHNLQSTGMNRKQAEAVVRMAHDLFAKAIERALAPVHGRIDVLEKNMATKSDIAELRCEMAAGEKRMAFTMLVGFVAIIAAIFFA